MKKKKHLIVLSDRQEIVLTELSKELGIPLSELIRRGLDIYIENLVKNGNLVRFKFIAGNKSAEIEMPKTAYAIFYEWAKNNPDVFKIDETKN